MDKRINKFKLIHLGCLFVFFMYNFFSSDCGVKDSEGKRPLHFAAHGKGSRAKDVVDVLIEEAASHIGNLVQYYIIILRMPK